MRLLSLQGLMSTLELLPMWGGAAPDVDLFFSGAVSEDDGEWAGGQTLGGSGDENGEPSATLTNRCSAF